MVLIDYDVWFWACGLQFGFHGVVRCSESGSMVNLIEISGVGGVSMMDMMFFRWRPDYPVFSLVGRRVIC